MAASLRPAVEADPFLDFDADDSGAQTHIVEPDLDAVFEEIGRAAEMGAR